MQNFSLHTQDKSQYPAGEWMDEPDKEQWLDEATGLPCLIVRNHHGSLCGYVGIHKNHPLYEKSYRDLDLSAHGGLTYSDKCSEHICHVVDPGEDDDTWWLGFDCAHYLDVVPAMIYLDSFFDKSSIGRKTYKNIEYAKQECRDLAQQLKETETFNNFVGTLRESVAVLGLEVVVVASSES